MSRSARAVSVACLAAAIAAGPTPAAGSPYRTYEVEAAKVAFQLPSGWRRDRSPDPEWLWQAVAPGYAAQVYVNAVPMRGGFRDVVPAYVQNLRKPFTPGNPHLAFSSTSVRVASGPAARITFRFRNLTLAGGPVRVATIYAFVHGGRFYVFEFVTSPKRVATMRPVVEHAIGSVRFPNVA